MNGLEHRKRIIERLDEANPQRLLKWDDLLRFTFAISLGVICLLDEGDL